MSVDHSKRNFMILAGALLAGGSAVVYGKYQKMKAESYNPPKTNAPEYTSSPSTPDPTPDQIYETIKSKETPGITQAPPETKEPLEKAIEYHDATIGTYERDDYVSYLGVKGKITSGKIIDGKVQIGGLVIRNKENELILNYTQIDHPTYGHLEMISYPQRGDVIMKQNGKDVALMKYETWADFSVYQKTTCEPDINPERTKLLLIERYGNC